MQAWAGRAWPAGQLVEARKQPVAVRTPCRASCSEFQILGESRAVKQGLLQRTDPSSERMQLVCCSLHHTTTLVGCIQITLQA